MPENGRWKVREIKFRSWDGKRFHYWGFIDRGFMGPASSPSGEFQNPMEMPQQQFTGLKDKNGVKEVYESDIIDENGLIRGNIYESESLDKRETDLIIPGLTGRIGRQPTYEHWSADVNTPSDMPIRMRFGNWTSFVKACGDTPFKPYLSVEARRKSRQAHKGHRSCNWRGGKHVDRFGYVQIWMPEHPNAKLAGYIHEHRLKMSEKLGRPLKSDERVHHRNKNRADNRISNLELIKVGKPNAHTINCPKCSFKFLWQ